MTLTVRRPPAGDALPALIGYTIALMAIPSVLIFKPLGAAGTPAQLIAVGLLGWWLISQIAAERVTNRINPVALLLLLFIAAMLTSYITGMTRPIAFSSEIRSADRALLSLCAWSGVTLVMTFGLNSRERLLRLLKVVAGGTAFITVLGMLQFFLKIDLTQYIHIPGLSANHEFGRLLARAAFHRINGTTSHPIEFGVVLSSTLPLLIHFARFSNTVRERNLWWLAVAGTAAALPMSVARSAMIGGAIAFLYLFHTWPPHLKRRALALIVVGAGTMTVVVPGLLGTIRGLFLGAKSDPSTLGRTQDYPVVWHEVTQHPLFGRGLGTYIPSVYRILDNQYLGMVVEAGLIGLAALLTFYIGSICIAGMVRRAATTDEERDLAQCLKAGLAVIAVTSATFDTFSFAMASGLIFVFAGAVGALWRTSGMDRQPPRDTVARSKRRIAAASLVLLVVTGFGAFRIQTARPDYWAYGTMVLVPRIAGDTPVYALSNSAKVTASALIDIMSSKEQTAALTRGQGFTYTVAFDGGSLAAGTDFKGNGSPTLIFAAVSSSPARANAGLSNTMTTTSLALEKLQTQLGVDNRIRISAEVVKQSAAFPVKGRPSRAAGILLILLALLATVMGRGIRSRRSGVRPALPAFATDGPPRTSHEVGA